MRTYVRNGQNGQVFSVDLLDAEGGEIRCSFFNDAASKFHAELAQGKIYTFANGSVKVANKKYNSLNHNYEIAFAEGNAAIHAQDDDSKISQMNWNIQSIRSLMNKEPPFNADLCGIIHKFESVTTIRTKKDNNEVSKRLVSFADSSGSSIDITLWGELAEMDDTYFSNNPAVCMKSVGIREWGTRTGSLSTKSNFVKDSANDDIAKQQTWWAENGKLAALTNLTQVQGGGIGGGKTPWATMAEMKIQGQDPIFLSGNDAKYFNCFVRLVNMKISDRDGKQQIPYYAACPKCNRKVDGSNSCIEHGTVEPTQRFMFSAAFSDHTDNLWLSCFDDTGINVFGCPASKMKDEIESMAPEKFNSFMKTYSYKDGLTKLTIRVKPDVYNDESRPRYTCVRSEKVGSDQIVDFMHDQFMAKLATESESVNFSRATALAQ